MTPAEFRLSILRKHAKLGPNGHPSHCREARSPHPNGKVTYRSREAAERAAAELQLWTDGPVLDAYECRAAKHFHLTKSRSREVP